MSRILLSPLLLLSLVLAGCAGSSARVVSASDGPTVNQARTVPASADRLRVAVGNFEMRTGPAIGSALADFMTTSLFNSGRFIVLERSRLDAVRAEQALQSGPDFDPDSRVERGGFEGADLLVRGAVVTFEKSCKGVSVLVAGSGTSCITLNLRLIDVATGRIVNATTVEATSRSGQVGFFFARGELPVGLGGYAKTPMETALRNAIELAVQHIVDQTN